MILLFMLLLIVQTNCDLLSDYKTLRNKILNSEFDQHLGQDLYLSETEIKVNNILMIEKLQELDEAIKTGEFLPAKSFYLSKEDIEKSKVYQLISKMPKAQ